ncbi:MAG: HAD family phosphatase [Candidatus Sericytochromatia bacterium]|nr:HAD family phosphatase [Candidatus Sericytochromatia bacterium]
MGFKAVLFDMDGVICDTMPLHRQVWRQFASTHGITLSDVEWRKLDGRRAGDIVAAVFGVNDAAENLRLSEARENLYREVLQTADLRAVAGVQACLEWLKERGIPCVLATSATSENVVQVLGTLGLTHYFSAIVSAQDVKNGKPDPEVYETAARRAGVHASECLVVEDAIQGVQAAKSAGATCLGLTTSEPASALLAAGAVWVQDDLTFFETGLGPDDSPLAPWFHALSRP